MKFAAGILLFLGLINPVFSQDTLFFLNKTVLQVKVKEIGVKEVKYSRYDNLNGPLYVTAKNELQYIKFQDGAVDTIKSSKPLVVKQEKMFILNNKLYYSGRTVNDERLLTLLLKEPAPKQKILVEEYAIMRSHKKKQQLFFFGGAGAGLVIMGISEVLVQEFFESNAPYIVGLAAGATIGATGIIFSVKNRKARLRKKMEIVDHYNNL